MITSVCKKLKCWCSLNGNRTRISTLRGSRPKPLDDKALKKSQWKIQYLKAAPLGVEPRLS